MTEFISTCSMPLAIVFLIAGFFLLVKGADVLWREVPVLQNGFMFRLSLLD